MARWGGLAVIVVFIILQLLHISVIHPKRTHFEVKSFSRGNILQLFGDVVGSDAVDSSTDCCTATTVYGAQYAEGEANLLATIRTPVWMLRPNCSVRWQFLVLQLPDCDDFSVPLFLESTIKISRDDLLSANSVFDHIWLTDTAIVSVQTRPLSVPVSLRAFLRFISLQKHSLLEGIRQSISYRSGAMIESMTVTGRAALDDDTVAAIGAVGLSHMVAISGFHLSVLLTGMRSMLSLLRTLPFFSRGTEVTLLILCISIYVWSIGASPSVLRAGLMAVIQLVAWWSGRQYEPWSGLFLAVSILLLIDPYMLGSVSFQLSVSALIGILWGMRGWKQRSSPSTSTWTEQLRQLSREELPSKTILLPRSLRDFLQGVLELGRVSAAACIGTAPITWRTFGELQPISIISGSLLGWMLPLMIVTAYLVVVVFLIAELVGMGTLVQWIVLFATPLIDMGMVFFWKSLELLAHIPFGFLEMPAFHWRYAVVWWGGWFLWKRWWIFIRRSR